MKIGRFIIDRDAPPFIIAEIGVNHDGDPQRALELLDAAHQCGADAVKLQLFEAQRLLSRAAWLAEYQCRSGESDPVQMLRRLQIPIEAMAPVVDRAHAHGMAAIATVFSVELVEPAAGLPWDAWKVASPDIINRPLIDALIATKRPMLLSTGASTLAEVQQALDWLGDHPHIVMQCVSAYPTPDELASLAGRHELERLSPSALGYSDHTTNVLTGALAVASGARVLEKHITYDRGAAGPDHAASLDQAQLSEYVEHAQKAFAMLGPRRKEVLDIERDVRRQSRQSIVAAHELQEGATIRREDLTIKRPGGGIAPALIDDVIGRTVAASIARDTPLTPEVLR